MAERYNLDVLVTRGDAVESRHRVHAAVVDGAGVLVGSAGDPSFVTAWRSCAKPFQALPFVESGGFDQLGWGDDELALTCASHGGEPEHVELAHSMLDDIGLEEGDLACGVHEPLSARGARLARESGARLTRLHNNCSGKHAAMLAAAHVAGWPTEGYERLGHPVQTRILETIAQWADLPASRITTAVDGCGAVVFGLPVEHMSRAYAKLAMAARDVGAAARIVATMVTHPFLVGGTDRFDTVLMEETNGRVLAKVGAEGVHSLAILDRGVGLTVKVEDGAQRAQYPAVLRLLQILGALPDRLPPRLVEFAYKPIMNTRGEQVGGVHVAD